MNVAPAAEVDDGVFDVTIWAGFGLRDSYSSGARSTMGRTSMPRGRGSCAHGAVDATSTAAVLLDVDGEAAGRLPIRVELLPGALRFKA